MKFEFTDKASYLAWREEWKAAYKALSQEIRETKRGRKMFLRTYETSQGPMGKTRTLIAKTSNPKYDSSSWWKAESLGATATYQLEQLKEAKEIAWNLKQAAKASAAD